VGAREGQDEPDEPGLWARCLGAPRHRRGEQAGLARPRRNFSKISSPQTKKCGLRIEHARLVVGCSLYINHNAKLDQGNPRSHWRGWERGRNARA
jgi:hypothetical protein